MYILLYSCDFYAQLCDNILLSVVRSCNVYGIRREKLVKKTIRKLATRLMKLYNLSPGMLQ